MYVEPSSPLRLPLSRSCTIYQCRTVEFGVNDNNLLLRVKEPGIKKKFQSHLAPKHPFSSRLRQACTSRAKWHSAALKGESMLLRLTLSSIKVY